MIDIKDDNLIKLRDAINDYIESKKFKDSYNDSADIKILVNGSSGTFGLNGAKTKDFALKNSQDINDVGIILEYIVADNKAKVYEAISNCMSYATAS